MLTTIYINRRERLYLGELPMRFQEYIVEGDVIQTVISKVRGFTSQRLQDFLYKEFEKFVEMVQSTQLEPLVVQIINRKFDTRVRSLEEFKDMRIPQIKECQEINEDLAHWWDLIKSEAFPTLSFYPALQVWLELDKVIKGGGLDARATIVYALVWILLVSGKYIKGYLDWKKQNPEEHATERAQGKGGIV